MKTHIHILAFNGLLKGGYKNTHKDYTFKCIYCPHTTEFCMPLKLWINEDFTKRNVLHNLSE